MLDLFCRWVVLRVPQRTAHSSDSEECLASPAKRHGSFDSAIKTHADLLWLNPEYSSLFDDLYRHLHLGGPPVALKQTDPVLMDLKCSLVSREPIFVNPEGHLVSRRKIGRREPCPCGSGKKYKRCCSGGFPRIRGLVRNVLAIECRDRSKKGEFLKWRPFTQSASIQAQQRCHRLVNGLYTYRSKEGIR